MGGIQTTAAYTTADQESDINKHYDNFFLNWFVNEVAYFGIS